MLDFVTVLHHIHFGYHNEEFSVTSFLIDRDSVFLTYYCIK